MSDKAFHLCLRTCSSHRLGHIQNDFSVVRPVFSELFLYSSKIFRRRFYCFFRCLGIKAQRNSKSRRHAQNCCHLQEPVKYSRTNLPTNLLQSEVIPPIFTSGSLYAVLTKVSSRRPPKGNLGSLRSSFFWTILMNIP